MDFVYKASEEPGSVCTLVTTDFAKAFDAVDHRVAAKCLLDLGGRPILIPWICNFMSNRRQRVSYQGYLSDWEYPSCGVAQGTILGPIIFLALTNNALQDQIAHWKYVDDMTMAQRWTSHQPCTLQQTLNDFGIWVEKQKMKLNSKKCKVLHVTRMKQIPAWPSLSIDQNILKICDSVKVLGDTIQSDLKWDGQVDHIDWLPPLREQLTGRQMRNSEKLTIPRCRAEKYRRSPIPYMCRLLNDYGF
uniref:Reverse transcriptase domain-containing protein n=1 Tax=Sinocyclocheilus anshuiensis TaxID=1608454 RepID=A0A671SHZ7_9TELE